MRIKDALTDVKIWIGLVVFFVMVGVAGAAWFKLPARVSKVEEKTEITEDKVQEVASTVDKFVMEQRIIRDEENKRDEDKRKSDEEYKKLQMEQQTLLINILSKK